MTLIDTIRAQYPHPIRLGDAANYVESKRYCVGGGICYVCAPCIIVNGFPAIGQLTHALRVANPRLPYRKAHYLAECIIRRNDKGHFEDAWRYAERALTYPTKED